ncbi:MAG TPA: ATP-grasp domain-containing protein [Anaeromyxobacteraceae bacterium]|nr:ATP-grasp domain-containing protein [Anaeromyxobacteraceae bacterium]
MRSGALLLLVPTRSYRTQDFVDAARRMSVPVLVGSDLCHRVEELFGGPQPDRVSLDYRDPSKAADRIVEIARATPIAGIVPGDDGTAIIAALAAERLGLPRNPPEAARRAGNKHEQRRTLAAVGVPVPGFALHPISGGPGGPARTSAYPCVLKPVGLSGSRGVIRADDPTTFHAAFGRIERLLARARSERKPKDASARESILVEEFVPGAEVALEGLLRGGELELLALFDKPDPLDGPYFEETIYVTPSRHAAALQDAVRRTVADACRALGLAEGPVHAELRLSPEGPVVLEIAARSIGGLCSRTLRFGAGLSLEELLVAHAMGLPLASLRREARASGVMMLPIPRRGILHGVAGLEAARAVPGVVDVVITVPPGREVVPLPDGDSYLGFVFAHGDEPRDVEAALRQAHGRLAFDIRAPLPVA